MSRPKISLSLPDMAATERFARELATRLISGNFVLLEGELGAGKTTLIRFIIRALAGDDSLEVPSPSFALVQPYVLAGQVLLHADLYRFNQAEELDELGLFDDPTAIVLVEWPQRAPALADQADLHIGLTITPDGDGRQVTITTGRNGPDLTDMASSFNLTP